MRRGLGGRVPLGLRVILTEDLDVNVWMGLGDNV